MSLQYIVPSNKVFGVNLAELDPLIETELGYPITINLIGQYLIIDGVSVGDETTVILLIDDYLKDEEPEPEVPTTQVIATGLDIRSLDRTRDSISIHDGGNSITVDGQVSLDAATLAALEFTTTTIQENATVNLTKVKGTDVDVGSGNSSAGTIRVVVATDNPSIAVGAAQSGNWDIRRNVISGSQYTGTLANSSALEASRVIKNSAGNLYRIIGYNSGPDQFIQVYNTSAIPANGSIPVLTQKIIAASNFAVDLGEAGIHLSGGICIGNSSSAATRTAGASDCFFTVVFK